MKKLISFGLIIALLVLFVACGGASQAAAGTVAAETPATSASRNVRNEPVSVTETYAKSNAASSAASGEQQDAASEAAAQEAAADTPATGNFPLFNLLFAVGLILVCAAGLVMLRRI